MFKLLHIVLISYASKVMLNILQVRLQQYVNCELPDIKAGFRKGRGTRPQIANIHWIIRKAREFQENIYFCFIDYAKAFDCVQFSSITQSCPTLCDPMNHSMPGLPVHHQLRVYQNPCTLSLWCHPTISFSVDPFPACPQSFPASGSSQMSQLFSLGGQSIGVSASKSVLPMNTQAWSPLGGTGLIFLQSKGLSRVFSNTTVQKHQLFSAQLFL